MSLHVVHSADERLITPAALRCVQHALDCYGRVTVLVPSLSEALLAQCDFAREGQSSGVEVTTPVEWARERWQVWGSGEQVVSDLERRVLCKRVIEHWQQKTGNTSHQDGMISLLATLASRGLAWLEMTQASNQLTKAEHRFFDLLADYREELRRLGRIEDCEIAQHLGEVFAHTPAALPPLVVAGYTSTSRATRELLVQCAKVGELTVVAPTIGGAGRALAQSTTEQLIVAARTAGVTVEEDQDKEVAPIGWRSAGLQHLIDHLFNEGTASVHPGLRVAIASGPSARTSLLVDEVVRAAREGARSIVLATPDARRTWQQLASRLVEQGFACRAALHQRGEELLSGRALIAWIEWIAHLLELSSDWPEPEVSAQGEKLLVAGDMSWWPPVGLVDALLNEVMRVSPARVRALDARWRGNRLLTPALVLDALLSGKDTSPECALATQELVRGRVSAAAARLLAPLPSGAAAPLRDETKAVLAACSEVETTLRALAGEGEKNGDSLEDDPLAVATYLRQAARCLRVAFIAVRPAIEVPSASCGVQIMGFDAASRLEPGSVDVLVLAGQTSAECTLGPAVDLPSELLVAAGIEESVNRVAATRARLEQMARVPKHKIIAEFVTTLDGKEPAYPSLMLTELLAAHGIDTGAKPSELASMLPPAMVAGRSEATLASNLSLTSGAPAAEHTEQTPVAGTVRAEARSLVCPPRQGDPTNTLPVLSASQIETYLECPYKWMSLRRLRLRDVEAGFGPAEIGLVVHRSLELCHWLWLALAQERVEGGSELARLAVDLEKSLLTEQYEQLVTMLAGRATADPRVRLARPGSAYLPDVEAAAEQLSTVVDAVLEEHRRERIATRPHQSLLIPHNEAERGSIDAMKRNLRGLVGFEQGILQGFEPRFAEWAFGDAAHPITYAGVQVTGTIDRIDVDSHGQAAILDYKYRTARSVGSEYAALVDPKASLDEKPVLPRHIQSLLYAQIVRRELPDLQVRAALYLGAQTPYALSGAVDANLADLVVGEVSVGSRLLERMAIPRTACFGQEQSCGFEALLDVVEEQVAERVSHLLAGEVEANPCDARACDWCPVLNCDRRIRL